MDIGQLILDALRSEYKNGATQTEMARRHGIPQSYMQRLLAGTRPAGGISIDTFQRMFPNAVIDLQGAVVGDNHGIVNGNNIRNCNQSIHNVPAAPPAAVICAQIRELLELVMDDAELDNDTKIRLFRIFADFQRRLIASDDNPQEKDKKK